MNPIAVLGVALGVGLVVMGVLMDTTVGQVHNIGLQQTQMMTLAIGLAVGVTSVIVLAIRRPV
jgi:hypothetical protein